MSFACIIIAGGKRTKLIDERIVPSVLAQGFDDILVVGEHHDGTGYRYLHIPDMTATTNDALVKRDVGTLATDAQWLLYLSDDHALTSFDAKAAMGDAYIPNRWCWREGLHQPLNSGAESGYCAGHAGLFKRKLIMQRPWTTMPHHPNWDVLASQIHFGIGAAYWAGNLIVVEDLEPEREPWR